MNIFTSKNKLLLILAIILWSSQAWATTYYIDPTCSSTGDGTTTTCGTNGPFRKWAEVSWAAGNTYSQKGGTTAFEMITVGASGTAGNVITINSYGTGKAKLNGGITLDHGSWTANDPVPGVYSHGLSSSYNYPKLEDGVFLKEAKSSSCTNGNYARPYTAGGNKIYYKPTSGTPADHTFEEIRYIGINLVNNNYITIKNFSFEKFVSCISGYDFKNDHSLINNNITITNNEFYNSALGIGLGNYGSSSSNNSIINNTFDYIQNSIELFSYGGCDQGNSLGNNSSAEIAHNTITHCSQVYTPSGPAVYDWAEVNTLLEDKEGIGVQDLANSSIHNNNIYGACRGIFLFTCNRKETFNNNIYNNYIKTDRSCIVLFPDTTGIPGAKSMYNNNVYYNILIGGLYDLNSASIVLKNTKTPSTNYNNIFNNTIIPNGSGVSLWPSSDYFKIKNNIFYQTKNYPIVQSGNSSHIVYDYNLYNTYANGLYVNGKAYTLTQWKALGENYDAHSPALADPLFTNAAGGMYALTPSSPAKWAGVNVGLTIDHAGNPAHDPPSIGAYEFAIPAPILLRIEESIDTK